MSEMNHTTPQETLAESLSAPKAWTVPNHVIDILDDLMDAKVQQEEQEMIQVKKATMLENEDERKFRVTIPKTVTFVDVEERYYHRTHPLSRKRKLRLIDAIPVLPKELALVCFILNCLLPGLGTFISALAVPCCSSDPLYTKRWREVTFLNISAAMLQLFTVIYFFIGWFWSITWGVILYYRSVSRGASCEEEALDRDSL